MIVMSSDVQEPMKGVQDELACTIMTESTSSTLSFVQTASDVCVDGFSLSRHREGQDIRRGRITMPSLMQQLHTRVVDDLDGVSMTPELECFKQSTQPVRNELVLIRSQAPGPVINLHSVARRSGHRLRRFGGVPARGLTVGRRISHAHRCQQFSKQPYQHRLIKPIIQTVPGERAQS